MVEPTLPQGVVCCCCHYWIRRQLKRDAYPKVRLLRMMFEAMGFDSPMLPPGQAGRGPSPIISLSHTGMKIRLHENSYHASFSVSCVLVRKLRLRCRSLPKLVLKNGQIQQCTIAMHRQTPSKAYMEGVDFFNSQFQQRSCSVELRTCRRNNNAEFDHTAVDERIAALATKSHSEFLSTNSSHHAMKLLKSRWSGYPRRNGKRQRFQLYRAVLLTNDFFAILFGKSPANHRNQGHDELTPAPSTYRLA